MQTNVAAFIQTPLPRWQDGADHFSDVKFSALTFNMQFGQAWDPSSPDTAPIVIEDTISFLQEADADILFLQEVEHARPGGEQIWPPRNFTRLKEALHGYHSVFAYPEKNPDELPFGVGLAIFAKTPLVDFTSASLPPPPLRFDFQGRTVSPSHRQLVGAKTRLAGRTVQLFNTHLQAFFMIDASSVEHREQRDLVERAILRSDAPTLMGGDFNCAPGEGVVEQFTRAGYRAVQDAEPTWRRRPYVMDHLFCNAGLKAERGEVVPTLCSDHHAVRADFRLVS